MIVSANKAAEARAAEAEARCANATAYAAQVGNDAATATRELESMHHTLNETLWKLHITRINATRQEQATLLFGFYQLPEHPQEEMLYQQHLRLSFLFSSYCFGQNDLSFYFLMSGFITHQ